MFCAYLSLAGHRDRMKMGESSQLISLLIPIHNFNFANFPLKYKSKFPNFKFL